MEKFDWLLFDLDNTILDFGKSSKVAFKNLLTKIDSELDHNLLYPIYNKINHEIWDLREAGKISHDELKWKRWHLFFEEVSISFDPQLANDSYFEDIKKTPFYVNGAEQLLADVYGKYKLMIVTNGLSEVQWSRMNILNMRHQFEHIVISDEIGVAKPQSKFFDHCHNLMGLPSKEKVLVIGDTLKSDIKGGNEFGYKTCWYNYYKDINDSEIQPDFTIAELNEMIGFI